MRDYRINGLMVMSVWGLFCCAAAAFGPPQQASQRIALPLVISDAHGIAWDIQPDGSIGDGGNDLYDGGGHLSIDGDANYQPNGPATVEPSGEVVLETMELKGLRISRRIAINKELGFCRWAEVIENPTAQKSKIQLHIHFDLGPGIESSAPFVDEKHGKQVIGLTFGGDGKFLAVLGAGRGSKLQPKMEAAQGSDQFHMQYDVEIPPKQTIVIVHAHIFRPDSTSATSVLSDTKEEIFLAALPKELLKKVINFKRGDKWAGAHEILRGELFDVIEMKGGDRLQGKLLERSWKIESIFGLVERPADKIIGLINVGDFRTRQLLVTADGEILGGRLATPNIAIEMTGGQTVQVPLSQITRIGHRKRPGEPEEWRFDKPMVLLQSGERIFIRVPGSVFDVSTKYGKLKLRATDIARIEFASEEMPLHEIELVDGTRFAGVVADEEIELIPAGQSTDHHVKLPASAIARLQVSQARDIENDTPTMVLANGDRLVGALAGSLTVETAFDSISVSCPHVRRLARVRGSIDEAAVTLWDESIIQGRLREARLAFSTRCGIPLSIPVTAAAEYFQPRPRPSDAVLETIKLTIANLSDESWKTRDSAQVKLLAIGPVAIETLKQLRAAQPPEGRQRIDLILPILENNGKRPLPPPPPPQDEEDIEEVEEEPVG